MPEFLAEGFSFRAAQRIWKLLIDAHVEIRRIGGYRDIEFDFVVQVVILAKPFEPCQNQLFPKINMFCYGQVESRYGSGQFLKDLQEQFKEGNEKLALSKIENKEGIMKSIKDFLGKGK